MARPGGADAHVLEGRTDPKSRAGGGSGATPCNAAPITGVIRGLSGSPGKGLLLSLRRGVSGRRGENQKIPRAWCSRGRSSCSPLYRRERLVGADGEVLESPALFL